MIFFFVGAGILEAAGGKGWDEKKGSWGAFGEEEEWVASCQLLIIIMSLGLVCSSAIFSCLKS